MELDMEFGLIVLNKMMKHDSGNFTPCKYYVQFAP